MPPAATAHVKVEPRFIVPRLAPVGLGYRHIFFRPGPSGPERHRPGIGQPAQVTTAHEPGTIHTMTVWTIGHGTRTIEELIGLLAAHGIGRLADVRAIPRSRHNPQFNRELLQDDLERTGVAYVHMPGLGGLRKPRPDSVNTGWRNRGFRGYADYMQTPEFRSNLDALHRQAGVRPTAIMCAETVPWRCHRSLIADALVVRGVDVRHIMSAESADVHRLTATARVREEQITYPADVETGRLA